MRKAIAKVLILRGNRKKYLRELRKLEWASAEDLHAYQQKELARVLSDARTHVPYYKTRATGDRLEDFPILTRSQIQTCQEELMVQERVNKKTSTTTTSGTTSEPMNFVLCQGQWERGIALNLFFYEWAKVEPGDPFIKFWGSFPAKTRYRQMRIKLSDWIRHTASLNTFDLRTSVMDGYLEDIQRIKPKGILAYAMPAFEFAKYVERKGIDVTLPGSIITSVSTLTPQMRKTIERAFHCHVFDRYGSREMMDMACDCDRHEGLHVNPYLQYLEILDENDQPCKPGQMGRIVATQLHNPVMPLIRYDTRDYATWAESPCSCGRNWPMIKRIDGRRINMFRFRDGGCMSSYYLIYHINHIIGQNKIKKQQIIQEDYARYRVKLVLVEPEKWAEMSDERTQIASIVSERIGEPVEIQYELCDEIPNQPSGKFLQSICKIPEEK